MIRVWRSALKRGESGDSKWCFTISRDGHIIHIATGYETQEAACKAADAWGKE